MILTLVPVGEHKGKTIFLLITDSSESMYVDLDEMSDFMTKYVKMYLEKALK